MTPHEKKLLDFIAQRIEATGFAPTYSEMANHLGLKAKSGIARRVDSLVAQGRLVRSVRKFRGLSLNTSPLAHVSTAALQAELARREQAVGQ